MHPALGLIAALFSVLTPQKMWYAPSQPLTISVQSDKDVTLELTDFFGSQAVPKGSANVTAGQSVDIQTIFPQVSTSGIFLLFAVPKGTALKPGIPKDFLGTPLVIEVRPDRFAEAPDPMIIRILPLQYVSIKTSAGTMVAIMDYQMAPLTDENFLGLASEGFYDGLTFQRVVPNFVIQGGAPTDKGTSGPGYHIEAEFNPMAHEVGVLSMARGSDPQEDKTTPPRLQYANSAGSQFFICLDYQKTKVLDRRYTAFGRVVKGLDVLKRISESPLADPRAGKPMNPITIDKMEVLPVTASDNPYVGWIGKPDVNQ